MSGGVVAPPGTPAAVSRGCSCVPYDDDGPRDPRWPDWLTLGCPVHGDKLAPVADGEPQQ